MANIKSAKKRIRSSQRRNVINSNRESSIRTAIKKVREAVATGKPDVAQAALRAAQPEIQRGVVKGVLHQKTASRKISRLAKQILGLSKA